MVSGATYWTKCVSISPELFINEAPTVPGTEAQQKTVNYPCPLVIL